MYAGSTLFVIGSMSNKMDFESQVTHMDWYFLPFSLFWPM